MWYINIFLSKHYVRNLFFWEKGSVHSLANAAYGFPPRSSPRRSQPCSGLIVTSALIVMSQRQYQRVSAENRQPLDAFRDGVDYLVCAVQLGIRRGTAYSVIRRYQT